MGIVKDILYNLSNINSIDQINKQSIFPYYHIVSDENVKHIKHLYKFKNISQFEKDLEILVKNYKPLHPQELINHKEPFEIPNNKFLITLDDGLKEVFTVIAPILKKRNLSAIFFINPEFIDNQKSLYKHDISYIIEVIKTSNFSNDILQEIGKLFYLKEYSKEEIINQVKSITRSNKNLLKKVAKILSINISEYLNETKPYLTLNEIKELNNMGFYFGGHTMTHPRLTELPIEEQTQEVIGSMKWLKEKLDINYSFFAFPFWDKGISKELIQRIFEYDKRTVVFANSGIKKDIYPRIIHRFSLENPIKDTKRQIITENYYKFYNKMIGKYQIQRS